jgi:hypothetical protein
MKALLEAVGVVHVTTQLGLRKWRTQGLLLSSKALSPHALTT